MSAPLSWVYGDKDSSLIVTLKDDTGTVVDLTGATSITLQCQKVGNLTATAITGSIYGFETNGQVRFVSIAQGLADPGPNALDHYRARVKWLRSGNSDPDFSWSRGELAIEIRRFPA